MIQHATMVGWPKQDVRCYRFPLPNEVWLHKLRPVEFVILAYLHYRKEVDLSPEEITRGTHLSAAVVKKHLPTLMGKGIMTKAVTQRNFFSLPNEIFLLKLPPTAFTVYAYLLTCEDRRTHRCHPSYRTIAEATGLSVNTVTKAVSLLVDKKLISMDPSYWLNERRMKMKGNNIYTILPIQFAEDMFHQQQLSSTGYTA